LCIAQEVPFRPPGNYDFKILNRFKLELNSYCHLYSKMQNDLNFESEFIQHGLFLPGRVVQYLLDSKILDPSEGISIVGLSVSGLSQEMLSILQMDQKEGDF